jgi:DNA helicase II / ATP-dependent DNA helicase PcrA
MNLSPQQVAAINFVRSGSGNAILEAVAGSGKTTTLVAMCSEIRGSAAFAAYNKKIATEIGEKLSRAGVDTRRVRAATFHSFGFSAWRRVAPGVRVDEKKVDGIMADLDVPETLRGFVKSLVSLAKQRAVGVLTRSDEIGVWREIVDHFGMEEGLEEGMDAVDDGIRWAWKVFQRSIKLDHEVVDFDDMIFAPLIHNVRMWQNDWVMIDEAQDTNPARRALAKKMLKPGGRLIAVGDPHQAIYGFTGADNDSLDVIAREFNCVRLPLTVTYRCPKSVVELARTWVGHISADDSAPEGSVRVISRRDLDGLCPEEGEAILCRNTKPLVELAFSLIRRRVPCYVEGREIGAGLMRLAKKWKKVTTVGGLRERLEEYLVKETERLVARGQEMKAEALKDRVDTLLVVAEGFPDDAGLEEIVKVLNDLFRDGGNGVCLSTVHKSKGREWPRVYLLGRNKFMPSPFARQTWQVDQERNLMYVAVTRAMDELVEVVV